MTATTITAPVSDGVRQSRAALHSVPERNSIVREQIEAVGVAIRKEQWFFVGTLVAFLILAVYGALRSGHGEGQGSMEFAPAAVIPMSLVALLIPFGVWRASDRERRAYDWAMPIAQSEHTIIRTLAGWLWLMLGVVMYIVFVLAVEAIVISASGGSLSLDVPAWIWVVPFTATTIAYLLTSIAIIGSAHPWRWIGGIVVGYVTSLLVLQIVHMQDVGRVLEQIFGGYYGLTAAIFGDLRTARNVEPNLERWLGATLIWGVLAIGGVWLAARRHSTN